MNKFQFFIDSPKNSEAEKIAEHLPPVVRYASIDPVKNVRMMSKDLKENDVPFVLEPDGAQDRIGLPFKHFITFESRHMIRTWLSGKDSGEIIAQVFHPDETYDLILIPITKYRYREHKEIKFNKYVDVLACPTCKGALLRDGKNFSCETCRARYPFTGNAVDFLPEKLRAEFSITPTDNVSDWGLDQRVIDTVTANPGKLYLDVGGGLPPGASKMSLTWKSSITRRPTSSASGKSCRLGTRRSTASSAWSFWSTLKTRSPAPGR